MRDSKILDAIQCIRRGGLHRLQPLGDHILDTTFNVTHAATTRSYDGTHGVLSCLVPSDPCNLSEEHNTIVTVTALSGSVVNGGLSSKVNG
jgi:hypothetical protein